MQKSQSNLIRPYVKHKPCPFCGCDKAVMMRNRYGEGYFIRCPECWAITKEKFTWLATVDAWENGEWSEETIYFRDHKRDAKTMNDDGALLLAEAIVGEAAHDYKYWLKRMKKPLSPAEKKSAEHAIKNLEERFFKGNPIMKVFPMSGDDVISNLKKQVERDEMKRKNRSLKGQ